MGAFKSAILTKKGQDLLTKTLLGKNKLEFTQIKTSESVLSGDLASRTDIGTVKQAEKVASIVKQDAYTVKVSTSFSNEKLTAGYYIRNIGLYAMDPTEGEILYSISVADESTATADWMPPFNGAGMSSLMIDLITSVSNASTVKIEVDPTANATVAQILEVNEHLTALDNTITTTTEKTLRGSVAGGLKINKVFGKSEQDTTLGEQLANLPTVSAITVNGITWSCKNGEVTAKGTASDLSTSRVAGIEYQIPAKAGTYYVSGGSTNLKVFVSIMKADGTVVYKSNIAFTLDGTENQVFLYCQIASGVAVNETVYPMLSKGNTAIPYEPYTGCIPAPNPDYPQEIKGVKVSEIKAHGKNLLDLRDATVYPYAYGITMEVLEDGGIKLSGTATTYALSMYKVLNLVRGEYVLSHNGSKNALARIRVKKGDGTSTDYVKDVPFSVDGTEVEIRFMVQADTGWVVDETIYPMLRYVNIADGTYEPYKENLITLSQPITLNGIGELWDELTPNGVVRKFFIENKPTINSISAITFSDNEAGYRISCKLSQKASISVSEMLSNALRYNTNWAVKNGFSISSKGDIVYVQVSASDFPDLTVEAFAQYMQEVNLTFVLPLEVPVVEQLPIVDQLALRSLLSYDGSTCLGTSSEVDPVIEAEYGTNKTGAHTLTGLLTAQRNEIKLAELTSTV